MARGGPWLAAATALTVLASTIVSGCAHTNPAPAEAASVHIDVNIPQGLRAQQLLDMVNSDWPLGSVTVGTLARADLVEPVTIAMDRLWADRPITLKGVEYGAGNATLHVVTSYGLAEQVELRTDESGLVDRLKVTVAEPEIRDWPDVDAELTRLGAHFSYAASRVTDGRCTKVAGTNVDEPLPLASIFKLYVLLALAEAVNAGDVTWDDQLLITKEAKDVGSAGFDDLQPGAQVSVKAAAQQMISASDNMATDLLMTRLGPGAVERALVTAGHHDPAAMTPFPNTHQLFSIGWGKPDLREEWQHASPQRRAELLTRVTYAPYQPDPDRIRTPASPYGVEWYGTAMDVCRVHAALQTAAVGPAAKVRDILSATPGIELDPDRWTYVGGKGGNLPGDLTFSWFARDRTGQGWVVSYQLTWPAYRSLASATWLQSIARQSFDLLPAAPNR